MNINKVKFQQFVKQAKGQKIFELYVSREDRKSHVLLLFNGRAPRQRNRLNGQWRIDIGDKDAAAVNAEVNEFLATARKHFIVERGTGLEDEVFADAEHEAKVAPITKDSSAT